MLYGPTWLPHSHGWWRRWWRWTHGGPWTLGTQGLGLASKCYGWDGGSVLLLAGIGASETRTIAVARLLALQSMHVLTTSNVS